MSKSALPAQSPKRNLIAGVAAPQFWWLLLLTALCIFEMPRVAAKLSLPVHILFRGFVVAIGVDRRGSIGRFDGQSPHPIPGLVATDSALDFDSTGGMDLSGNHVRSVHGSHVDQAEHSASGICIHGRSVRHQWLDDVRDAAVGAFSGRRPGERCKANCFPSN